MGRAARAAAGGGAAGPRHHRRAGPAPRPRLELRPPARGLRRDGARRCPRWPTSPGTGWSARAASPTPARRRTRRARRSSSATASRPRPAAPGFVPAGLSRPGGDAGRRLPLRAHHRPAAGTLAHRRHDPPRRRAGRAGARPHRLPRAGRAGAGSASRPGSVCGWRRGAARSSSRPAPIPACRRGWSSCPSPIREAAANLLTNPQLDPFGKIPEFKYCAVRVEAVPDMRLRMLHHGKVSGAGLITLPSRARI